MRLFTILLLAVCAFPSPAAERWTEFNLGPFYVLTDSDEVAASDTLVQLEQVRWVLGNLLEDQDLRSLWPIRIIVQGKRDLGRPGFPSESLSGTPDRSSPSEFVWQNGQYILLTSASAPVPLGEIATLLLDANTPRLPAEVESGLRQLFSTLHAKGSHVTWGGQPLRPDLAWARMQLFATKFEYGASFHIFLTALKGGSTLAAAERDAFGKSSAALEAEAKANLAQGHWTPTAVSGRPLDPKRDLGQHEIDPAIARVYLADWSFRRDLKSAEAVYHSAVATGGAAAPLGYEGLAEVAKAKGQDTKEFLNEAIQVGSRSAPVYVAASEDLPEDEAVPLLKRAAQLNPRWAVPIYYQVEFARTPAEKESLLKSALKLDPRATNYWIELAKLQTSSGEATAAQGSWLRAEDSAPTDSEREHIHQLADASEQERLNAAEAARQRDRNAAHLADEQAQQAETDRIRATEQKANQAVDHAAGDAAPSAPVAWNSLQAEKHLAGSLTRVDCLKHGHRLWIKNRNGAVTELLLPETLQAPLSCGVQMHPLRISLQYRDAANPDLHIAGEITSLELR